MILMDNVIVLMSSTGDSTQDAELQVEHVQLTGDDESDGEAD